MCDRQGSPCPRAYFGRGAQREKKKQKEVFINDIIFIDLDVSRGICGTMSLKSTYLIGQQLARGNKISCSGDC